MVSLGSGTEEMGRDAAGRFGEVGPCLKGTSFKADLLSCILKQWLSCDGESSGSWALLLVRAPGMSVFLVLRLGHELGGCLVRFLRQPRSWCQSQY